MEKKVFQVSKTLFTSSKLRVHFNPVLKLVLMCDASSYGIGAVLAHRMPDGTMSDLLVLPPAHCW